MISATNSAAPNEEKPKLADPTKYEVKFSMSALITKVKKPSVSKVNGNEMTIRIGLIKAFRIDSTKLAITAVRML